MLFAPAVIVMVLVAGWPIINTFILSLQRADLRFPQNNSSSALITTAPC